MFDHIKSLLTKFSFSVRIAIFIILSIFTIYISSTFYDEETIQFENKVYERVNTNILDTVKLLIKQKQNASLLTALSLSKNPILIDIVFGKPYADLKLKDFSLELKEYSDFKDVKFSIIDIEGNIIKRSWTHIEEDSVISEKYFANIIENKKPISFYSVNKFGLTINSLVPILYDGDLAGVLNVITHFDSIAKELLHYDFNTVIFLDEKMSSLIDIKESLSKKFIKNSYVANKNADDLSMKIINSKGIEHYINFKGTYQSHPKTNTFETRYLLNDKNNNTIGYMILMKSLEKIDMGDLENNQDIHIAFTIFIIITIGLISYYRNSYNYIAQIKADNEKLLVFNAEIKDKNDELDFNEKKIANIFHIQPNFMLISDGQSIESANARFLWFFSTYYEGGLEEFRKNHRCISDYFIKCEDNTIDTSDYIYGDTIEGEPWKDYILKNYKRQYKVCMKNGHGGLHHFIIKMTEMEYAKLVKRYIVISFMDITYEINLMKKTQQKQIDIALKAKEIDMQEHLVHISHQLKQPINSISLDASNMKFKQEMKLLKEGDLIKFADHINLNSKYLLDTIDEFVYTKKEKVLEKQINLVDSMNLFINTLKNTYNSNNIKFRTNMPSTVILKTIEEHKLSQVINNIMLNAKDVLDKQSKEDKWISFVMKKDINDIIITIEDNGGGITDDILPKIFDENFTTKGEIKGTGLGLYISKDIVKNKFKGDLSVENTQNGAMFKIKIPLDKE
ncbi:MAG: HAMP domain-containing histidine kinase [Arcobacteraceae bacterium]|nr:HAMP domain-containing histidine kinase [Arcobacteraceae bacterium]